MGWGGAGREKKLQNLTVGKGDMTKEHSLCAFTSIKILCPLLP